jgi:hypothetical protein
MDGDGEHVGHPNGDFDVGK